MTNAKQEEEKLNCLIRQIEEIIEADEVAVKLFPGATPQEIADYETAKDLKISEQYRQWLEYTDGCCLFDSLIQLFGVAHQPFIEKEGRGLPEGLLGIGHFCFGETIALVPDSNKVGVYGEENREYSDFWEFMDYVLALAAEE